MEQVKTISDSKLNEYKLLLEDYKYERNKLKEKYHEQSKVLTSKIHDIEHIIIKEDGIRNQRGKYWLNYVRNQIMTMYEENVPIADIAKTVEKKETNVKKIIEDIYWMRKRKKLDDFLFKSNGEVNDNLPLELLFCRHFFEANPYKEKQMYTVGDVYKNKNKLTKHQLNKIEREISFVKWIAADRVKAKIAGQSWSMYE